MARGNGILMTHNGTGGSGTLTLVAVTGFPDVTKVFGTSGTRLIELEINEYTDSTYTVLSKQETGIWSVNLSTLVATRTKVLSTWDGTTYLPNPGSASAPSALTIGNTAANVRIVCAPNAAGILPPTPFIATSTSDTGSQTALNFIAGSSSAISLTAGFIAYTPVLIAHHGPFSQATMRVTTAMTGGSPTLNVALYEVGSDGLPGNKLIDFGSVGAPNTAATLQNTAIGTPVEVVPGWYWQAVLPVAGGATGNPSVRAANILAGGMGGTSFGNSSPNSGIFLSATGQTSLPSTAVAIATINNSNLAPLVAYK